MNKELTGYSLTGSRCIDYYEGNRKYHISENYTTYGDVLVETQNVLSGISFKVKLYWRNHWYWKPSFHWRNGLYYFHWIFFFTWFELEYVESNYKVIKDHLKEWNEEKC